MILINQAELFIDKILDSVLAGEEGGCSRNYLLQIRSSWMCIDSPPETGGVSFWEEHL